MVIERVDTEEYLVYMWKCLKCGDRQDPVIAANRVRTTRFSKPRRGNRKGAV